MTGAPDPSWGFGLGGTVFVASLAALWGGVVLRGKTNSRLRQSVDLAYAGLAERAIMEFQHLQGRLVEFLPDSGAPFDPAAVVADPNVLEKAAKKGVRALRERQAIKDHFRRILAVCSVLKWVAASFTLLVALATAAYFFFFDAALLWQSLGWSSAGVALVGAALIAAYAVLEAKIERCIEDSDPLEGDLG